MKPCSRYMEHIFVSDLEKMMSGCSDPGFLGTLTRALLSRVTQIVGN